MEKVTLILTCAGCGSRANFEKNKLLEKIDGQTVIERAFYAFYDSSLIDEYIITASKIDFDELLKQPKTIIDNYGGLGKKGVAILGNTG